MMDWFNYGYDDALEGNYYPPPYEDMPRAYYEYVKGWEVGNMDYRQKAAWE